MLHGGVRPDLTGTHHLGLRATTAIPVGTVVWFPCRNCPTWTPQERRLLPRDADERLDTWGHLLQDGSLLVPCSGAALMNHSCAANVLDFGLDFGVAVADIPPGSEVTCDYSTFFADEGWSMPCACRVPRCRGEVTVADYACGELRQQWTTGVERALRRIGEVEQPLGPLLATWSETYRRVLAGATTLDEASVARSIVSPGFLGGR